LAQIDSRTPGTPTSSQEAALRQLVERFFAAYGRKNLDALLPLWSQDSPNVAAHKQSLEQQFATEDFSFATPAISRIVVEGDKASLRTTVDLTAINLKSKKKREQRLVNNFELINAGGEWKVWRSAPAVNDLAEALIKARDEAERAKLLSHDKGLATPALARALIDNGNQLFRQGSFARAADVYRLAQRIAEQISDQVGIAGALGSLGRVRDAQGNYAQALESYQKGLVLFEAIGDKIGISATLNNIGMVYFNLNHHAQALEYYKRFLLLSESLGDQRRIGIAYGNIAGIYYAQDDHARALEYSQKGLAIREAMGDEAGIAAILSHMGSIYSHQGDHELSLKCYRRSLEINEARGDEFRKPLVLAGMAEVYNRQGQATEALALANRASALARRIGSLEHLWQALHVAGDARRVMGQPAQARSAFEESIAVIEALRSGVTGEQEQQRYFESQTSPYVALVELLIGERKPHEALTYAERAKSRVLLDVLLGGKVNITRAMTQQEQERERALKDELVQLNTRLSTEKIRKDPDQTRLAELETQLTKARLDLEAFRSALYAAHPELGVSRGEVEPLIASEAGALLPDTKTALLEFVVAKDRTYLFVLTRQPQIEVRPYPLDVSEKDLNDRIDRFRQMLANADHRFSAAARDLYRLLLQPAAEQLRGKSRLVVVPDGPLWELPIQALQSTEGRYFIEDHSIAYVPSLTVLREMIRARARKAKSSVPQTVLALGNPSVSKETIAQVKYVLMDERLEPLPEAERQVRSLERIYGGGRVRAYVGAEAREERFKSEASNYGILHLATHGILNDRSPMYSHLLLAQTGEGGKEDGLLEAWELMGLDLKADLAVLSACETARGRVGKGEGMIGLTWALFVAGVPTTVVSQWKVRSDSTAELMVEFHRRLRANARSPAGRGAASALREAALKVKADSRYRHPFHWAGFIVIGDGH
jgi:CHAT domain-containing protein